MKIEEVLNERQDDLKKQLGFQEYGPGRPQKGIVERVMAEIGEDKKRRKRFLIVGAACLVVILIAVGVWVGSSIWAKRVPAAQTASHDVATYVDFPDLVSNLDTGGRRATFVKMHVKLRVRSAKDAAAVTAAQPELVDLFQSYLRELRPEELHGGEGTYRLREALMNRADARLSPVEVTDLLFTQLLVQ